MVMAGLFLIRQRDFKRLLAYSSVEHMGILIVGIGTGGIATSGAFLHLLGNGLLKGTMFLSAANIHRAYGSKSIESVSGTMRHLPISSGLFLAGFLALTGAPPFVLFASEFTIATALFTGGHTAQGLIFLLALAFVFVGMGSTILAVVQGEGPEPDPGYRDGWRTVGPPAVFLALALLLGVHVPAPISGWLTEAIAYTEGTR
jgi:hydrogenase-4 component F